MSNVPMPPPGAGDVGALGPAVAPGTEGHAPVPSAPASSVFPSRAVFLDWRQPYLIPIALILISRGILAWLLPLATEDAYITYRYARNLALGFGPVFNPGEHVMGFSTPLWMVWNALGWLLTRDPVAWSRGWTMLGDVVTVVTGACMLSRHVSRASAWCFAFTFAVWIAFTGVAVSGMENSMMLTLIVLSGALAESGSPVAGVSLGALALIRPEGVAAAMIIAVRARWRERGVAFAIAALGALALTLYFGSPIPQSVIAKAQLYGTPGPWAGRHWWEWALPLSLGRWPEMPDTRFLFLSTVLTAPAAFDGLRVLWRIRRSGLAFATAACLAVWLGYAVTGAVYFYWYLVVPIAGWFLLAAMGLPRIVRGRAIYVSAALLMAGCWTVVWELYAGRARAEASFERVASYLVEHSSAWQKVMLEPIGIVGYRARLIVLDEVGLVTPQVSARRLRGPGWMSDVVASERPEWLVIRRGVLRSGEAFAGAGAPFRSSVDRDVMLTGYAVVTVIDEALGDAALVILRRRT